MLFSELGLSEAVLKAVEECGYQTPTPIQEQAIPKVLDGIDIIGASQTGTGKTAAFALPLLSKLIPCGTPQILVLEPTRELADQVAEAFREYAKFTGFKVALLYGGLGYGQQTEELQRGADIVVATPGRLVDHFYRGTMRFGSIKTLVLDEVDRMLDMGFLPIVRKIVNLCPWDNRQTLFFSATMPAIISSFARWCLTDPIEITIARQEVAATIKHAFYPVAMDQRDDLLIALLHDTEFHSVMIFTRTRKEADTVCGMLQANGHKDNVVAMHSDVPQKERMEALKGFKEGKYAILVATDVAARGIDVTGVTHVINYRVPENPEDYVHRIGRTGRAEATGEAFTLLTADEIDYATAVENFISTTVTRLKLPNFNYFYSALLDEDPVKSVRRAKHSAPKRRRR
ncbi:MAG: DEAD/DEAH box helicase [Akkermansia sp.]